jgi:hypothetical protein
MVARPVHPAVLLHEEGRQHTLALHVVERGERGLGLLVHDEIGPDPVDRVAQLERLLADGEEVVARDLGEPLLELRVALRQRPHVQPQVVREELRVLADLELPQAAVQEERVGDAVHRDPVADGAQLARAAGDRSALGVHRTTPAAEGRKAESLPSNPSVSQCAGCG